MRIANYGDRLEPSLTAIRSRRLPMTYLSFAIKSRSNMFRGVLAGVAFLATAGIASAATDADSPRSIEIRYGDLDLSTEQDAVVLYRRIAAGAQRVCPPEDLHNLGAHARSRACQTAAIAQAVRAVDNPKLAAVEAAHSQKSAAPKS